LRSDNTSTVHNTAIEGNVQALLDALRKHNIGDGELVALKNAVNGDEGKVDTKEKRFGPAVKEWLSRMLSKAADNSWQIELGLASNLLTNALQNYYGWLK
jgi:hypothetical protein